ncbi:MAG: hypothetical protein JWO67_6549, partial [Streptosporangiaceae bacterium]|nr:hypothetical protein [Streptosporangiaceae bacterium]
MGPVRTIRIASDLNLDTADVHDTSLTTTASHTSDQVSHRIGCRPTHVERTVGVTVHLSPKSVKQVVGQYRP